MTGADAFAAWRACGRLRQADIDRLLGAGVPVMALAEGPRGTGYALARDLVVPDAAAQRFELAPDGADGGEGVPALIALALDGDGEPADLVAFAGGPRPFAGSWLGRVGLLGEEQLGWARDALRVHASVLDWLRAGREGVVVVDPVRAAPLLRDAGTMEVASQAERRRLLDLMAVSLPRVVVRQAERRAAA